MQTVIAIDRIVIHFQSYAMGEKYYERMDISTRIDEGDQWSFFEDISSPGYETMTYMSDKRRNARYVKISNKKYLYLSEVQVFGTYVLGKNSHFFTLCDKTI